MSKKDHYVSRTYLRGFTAQDGRLIPYVKRLHNIVGKPKVPEQICYEIDGDKNTYFSDPRILDQYLPHFENPWAENVRLLGNGEMFADLRIEISGYIAFLRTCTPTAKRLGVATMEAMLQPLADMTLAQALLEDGELDPDIKQMIEREVSSGGIKVKVDPEYAHAQSIAVLSSLSCRLFCSGWLVLHNETDTPFITSDNPAPTIYLREGAYTGITYVPLTPKLALLTAC